MNRFEIILNEVKYFSKLIGHMRHIALEINKTADETKTDFVNSKRTGQCAIVVQSGLQRVGAHYSDDAEEKIRYSIVANNKINFLLENPERENTFPQNENERIQFESRKIFGGGIRTRDFPLVAVSGFHPRIDEGFSIVAASHMTGFPSDGEYVKRIQCLSKYFCNPYALAIFCGAKPIKEMGFEGAIEWGKNETK